MEGHRTPRRCAQHDESLKYAKRFGLRQPSGALPDDRVSARFLRDLLGNNGNMSCHTMHIERKHNFGKDAAISKIDIFLDGLMRHEPPGGVTVQDASKTWSGNIMNFSFKARKGFIGATISGLIQVNDDSVVMDFDLPGLVTAFVSEDKIRDTINQQLDGLFPA